MQKIKYYQIADKEGQFIMNFSDKAAASKFIWANSQYTETEKTLVLYDTIEEWEMRKEVKLELARMTEDELIELVLLQKNKQNSSQ